MREKSDPIAGTDDVIDLGEFGFSAFDDGSVNDVESSLSQVGSDAVIDLGGGNQITILGVNVGDLHANDFFV